MAKKRASLTGLGERLARKGGTEAQSEPAAPEPRPAKASRPAPGKPEPQAEPLVQVMVRMTRAERKALRAIALEHDTTVQELATQALRDLLRRYRRTDRP